MVLSFISPVLCNVFFNVKPCPAAYMSLKYGETSSPTSEAFLGKICWLVLEGLDISYKLHSSSTYIMHASSYALRSSYREDWLHSCPCLLQTGNNVWVAKWADCVRRNGHHRPWTFNSLLLYDCETNLNFHPVPNSSVVTISKGPW